MKVIMTGATGFIGVALCNEFLKNNYDVTAVIRPNTKRKNKIPAGVNIIELPLDRINELEGKYDLFYHLAWNGSSGNDRNDFNIQYSNIKYTADAIKVAKKLGCKKFIGAGSQAEYGVVHGQAIEDETICNPFMMYGAAKLAAYNMGKIVAEQEEISFVWPRIYSVYGPGENEGTLMSYLIKTLKEGNVPELSQCENMWDFMYIDDCVNALRILGESNITEGIYNISVGKPKLLKEFVEMVKEEVNSNGAVAYGIKKSDINKTFWLEPNIEKLKSLGFESKVKFREGIKRKAEE
ncbi:NAD-dependent epimerase/dehydratase family protein [Clostridium sp. MSJ-8]|uniref:NAD-dependent epimerase/dehydratase family protein n=1 Tax=Clostridium sp. MSJ-8 TaxID=2841510 RepID=UPI001C0EED88|nr:NAD-dependent epimerase/dehydratase family protein [Clostridium sp. MSJ-8]MBU5488424.1 NAD-dependent epimerase/dehydratase family protein [Clostridium sp. MSJ-8]